LIKTIVDVDTFDALVYEQLNVLILVTTIVCGGALDAVVHE
jgi:hypothetical protein